MPLRALQRLVMILGGKMASDFRRREKELIPESIE
jgi:hypothetical protein